MKKYTTIYILISILICIQNINSFAQDGLKGKITDIKEKKPLAGVSVYIPDLQRGTITNETGDFIFENLPKTTVQVQVTSVGFKTLVKTVNILTTTELNLEMEFSATEIEEVLITSNNSKLPDNTPFSANSLPQEEIRKYSSPSLMGNLSYQPGIDKITIGNGIGKPVIRGLSFNQIMLYSQGTRIENQQWDDHHDLGLTDVGVENVELVRGPAALIYGADALGGALIFKDEKPAATGTTIADANLGFGSNTLGINGEAGIKSTNNNGVFYGVRFGGTSQTSYVQGEDEEEQPKAGEEEEEFAPNSKFMNMTGKANVGVSKKWGMSRFSYSYLNQQIGIVEDESADTASTESDEEEQRDREMEAPYQDVTSHIISLENIIFAGKSKVNVNLAYQLNDRKEYEPLPDKQKELAIGLKLAAMTYDVKWTSDMDKNLGFTIGSQGLFLKNENNGKESLVPDADVSDFSGYGLVRYDRGKLNLLGGVRVDMRSIEAESYENSPGGIEEDTFIVHHQSGIAPAFIDTINKPEADFEKEYTPVSFSLGASYHVNDHFTLKLNGATGFSAPNYAQLGTFGKHEGTYRFERGNADLKIEQNVEGDIGLIWENESMTLNLGGYMNMVKDYIYIENTGDTMVRITPDGTDTLPIYDYKQGDAVLSGLEAGFDVHPAGAKWIDLNVSYSMTNGKLDAGGSLPYIPAGKLVGEVKLMKEKMGMFNDLYFSVIVSNYSKQSNVTEYELSSEGYTLFDLHIGGTFKMGKQKAMVDLFCTNLLNTAYFNQLSLVKYIGVRDMGRNIGVQLSLPLYFSNGK